MLERLQAVHLRHPDVEQDGVRTLTADGVDPRAAGSGHRDPVAFVLERAGESLPDGCFVVDDEDCARHDYLLTSGACLKEVGSSMRKRVPSPGAECTRMKPS